MIVDMLRTMEQMNLSQLRATREALDLLIEKKQTKVETPEYPVEGPRPYTQDEVIEILMGKLHSIAEYWAKTNLEDWRQPLPEFIHRDEVMRRCKGTAFTILSSGFDGAGLDLPGIDLVLCPHESDADYHREQGENWFEPEMRISTALHEHFHIKNGE